mmetsp:Transcript_57443/g.140194  ORF Transcript_57443/g.140194 Transcript_57443/m.140194 type:complete len:649 (+) Transcript_57443:120-2066(+)
MDGSFLSSSWCCCLFCCWSSSSSSSCWSSMYLRTVEPYPYCFATFAKQRWLNRTVLDVYSNEFGSYPKLYYETAIQQGRILINDQQVSVDQTIKGGDVLSHVVHRHEPTVWVSRQDPPWVTIVEETDDVVVVDKPPTLPIHPCGGYHLQCLMNLLEHRHDDSKKNDDENDENDEHDDHGNKKDLRATAAVTTTKLYTIHRLDRLTSGLVILGKSSKVAQKWGKSIQQRSCQKIYLARVAGKFPLNLRQQDNPSTLLLKRLLGSSSTELPLHGEWQNETTGDEGTTTTIDPAEQARRRNAYTYWITDGNGALISNETTTASDANADDVSLRQVFESQHSIDEWLASIHESSDGIAPANKNTDMSLSTEPRMLSWLHLACPTRIAKHKDGVCEAGNFSSLDDALYLKTVKPAHTSFGVVSYDEKTDSTLLICRPYTGRTHQIRIHLQHLGHAIANDPNYGGDMWYANTRGRETCQIAEDRLNVVKTVSSTEINHSDDKNNIPSEGSKMILEDSAKMQVSGSSSSTATMTTAIDVPATEKEILDGICTMVQAKEESIHDFVKRTCVWCARSNMVGDADRAVLEFLIRSPGIWLHALQYSFEVVAEDKDSKEEDVVDGSMTSMSQSEVDPVNDRRSKMTYRAPLPPWHTLSS